MKILILLLCFLVFIEPLLQAQCKNIVISEQLKKIPNGDLKKIEDLFKFLIWDSLFGYSLFGNKPVSTIGYLKKKSISAPLIKNSNFYFSLYSYWKIWEKYCYLFPTKNYLLIGQENDDWLQITLINRKVCLKIIWENLTLFQKKLGRDLKTEEVFKKITGKNLFQENLNMNHALCGILYGYEKENCLHFEESYSSGLFYTVNPQYFHQEHPLSPLKLKLPYFLVFSKNAEIIQLKLDYSLQREKIINNYNYGNFLEITLTRLME